ncbi:MAG TPA: 1-acyl-sn-glycerol-3-phosphate acyltransferase [Chitinophagaceae bacterium]|nr:1-acyl-sn-glycerol-3-phosphate acyltransferase [Chitinophagaceae bacterium]
MLIFCRKVIINKPAFLKEKGPLLLACNHPDSFLDAVILDTLFERPIWSLARGDVFKSKFIVRLLTRLKILPVYRVSEGVENLSSNYQTFEDCQKIFSQDGIVLIFSEGRCINEWQLRPLKKGTARLAISSWEQHIPLKVLPVGLNYSSFRRFGKNITINFGEIITGEIIPWEKPDGTRIQAFNQALQQQLSQLVFTIEKADKEKQKKLLDKEPRAWEKWLLGLPALLGAILHWPLYVPLKKFTLKKAAHNDHYDSILTALLLFSYPVYLLLISLLLFQLTQSWFAFLTLLIFPFTAWACVQLKAQLDK